MSVLACLKDCKRRWCARGRLENIDLASELVLMLGYENLLVATLVGALSTSFTRHVVLEMRRQTLFVSMRSSVEDAYLLCSDLGA